MMTVAPAWLERWGRFYLGVDDSTAAWHTVVSSHIGWNDGERGVSAVVSNVIINGRELEDLSPYLSRDGVALLWLVSQHLGAQVSWRKDDQSMVICGPGPLSQISSWMKGQLGKWSTAHRSSNGVVPPPGSLLASMSSIAGGSEPRGFISGRVDGTQPEFLEEVGDVEVQDRCAGDPDACDGVADMRAECDPSAEDPSVDAPDVEAEKTRNGEPGDESPVGKPVISRKKYQRSQTDAVVHHRPLKRDGSGSGNKGRTATDSRSSTDDMRQKLDLLARYRPG